MSSDRASDRRRRRTTLTAYVLFGAIIIVFVFWGIRATDMPLQGGYAAEVNNTLISVGDFRRALQRQTEFYSRMFGDQMDPNMLKSLRLKDMTLDQMIKQEVLVQGAEKEGIMVTDEEVRDTIFSIPAFQQNGRFQRDQYNAYLDYSRMSAHQFEVDLRRDTALENVREVFTAASFPTSLEVEREAQVRSTKINLDYLVLEPETAEQRIKVTDADVEKFINSEGSAAKIEAYYTTNKTMYSKDEEVHARHILVKANPNDAKEQSEALKKIEALKERLKNEDFAKVAQQASEDEGSKSKGGDLGFFSRGKMVPAFEEVAFTLEKGKVSDPVKSTFGYHLIEVLDKKAATSAPLETVRKDVARRVLVQDKLQQIQNEFTQALQLPNGPEKTKKINDLAQQAGLKWESTGAFDAGASTIPKIGGNDEVLSAAFSVNESNPYSSKLVPYGTKSYVLKFKESIQEKTPVKTEEIGDQVARARAVDIMNQWQKNLAEKASIKKNEAILAEEM